MQPAVGLGELMEKTVQAVVRENRETSASATPDSGPVRCRTYGRQCTRTSDPGAVDLDKLDLDFMASPSTHAILSSGVY